MNENPWQTPSTDIFFLLSKYIGRDEFVVFSLVCKDWQASISRLPPVRQLTITHKQVVHPTFQAWLITPGRAAFEIELTVIMDKKRGLRVYRDIPIFAAIQAARRCQVAEMEDRVNAFASRLDKREPKKTLSQRVEAALVRRLGSVF